MGFLLTTSAVTKILIFQVKYKVITKKHQASTGGGACFGFSTGAYFFFGMPSISIFLSSYCFLLSSFMNLSLFLNTPTLSPSIKSSYSSESKNNYSICANLSRIYPPIQLLFCCFWLPRTLQFLYHQPQHFRGPQLSCSSSPGMS